MAEFYKYSIEKSLPYARHELNGRRGTGKSTGVKRAIADEGLYVIWVTRTKGLAALAPTTFVPPAVREFLPLPEDIETGDLPQFKYGRGGVRVVPYSQIVAIKSTGLDCLGHQPDLIINDEYIPEDGRYFRGAPALLDSLAATVGRSGNKPPILCIGNPNGNANPFSIAWRANTLVEGEYPDDVGNVTRVEGTANCADCFGAHIGIDAVATNEYNIPTLRGGTRYLIDGRAVRVVVARLSDGAHYFAYYDDIPAPTFDAIARGRYTRDAFKARPQREFSRIRDAIQHGRAHFNSFNAELTLYELVKYKDTPSL